MTEYTPKVGDRVRRTTENGTVVEGSVDFILHNKTCAVTADGFRIYEAYFHHETELLHRPSEFKNEVGMCYRHPHHAGQVVVKIDNDESLYNWMGYAGTKNHWHSDVAVEELVKAEGWIEHDLQKVEAS